MQLIANTLYGLLLLMFVISGFFVVFHFVRYSYHKIATLFIVAIFVFVAFLLISWNISLYFSMPLEQFFPTL